MKNKNSLLLIAASFITLNCWVMSSTSATEIQNSFNPIEGYSESYPKITFYQVTYHRVGNNFTPEERVDDNEPQDITKFIQRGCQLYPLCTDTTNTILKDLEWHNQQKSIEEALLQAQKNDVNAISYIGSIYMEIDEYEKAKPWLFSAANQGNPTAYWLLASLTNAENLVQGSSYLKDMEQKLLEKSAELGNSFAKESLGKF